MRAGARPPLAFYSLLLSSERTREMRDTSSGGKTRANETLVLSRRRNALLQRNRAPQFSTCAPRDTRAHACVRVPICSIALSRSPPRLTCARARMCLHRVAYRPARNYAAFAARARYETPRVCVRIVSVCARDAPMIAFRGHCLEFYISREIR